MKRPDQPPNQWPKGYTVFSQMKGRAVERIELYAGTDSHVISICFQDQTDFTVKIDLMIDARLGFVTVQSDRSTGDQQVLKLWPTIEE